MKRIRILLIGNPNVGKTSLLNYLAGTNLLFLHPFFGFFFLGLILYMIFKLVSDLSSPLVDFIDGFFQDFFLKLFYCIF